MRRAGRGRLPDRGSVVWSVAEGSRGRRWREVRRDGRGVVVSSLLYETHPDSRFAHIELSTAAGLLTLHPEGDGTLHGNVVTDAGLRHLRDLQWTPESVVLVEGSVVASAAAARRVADGIRITLGLEVVPLYREIISVDTDGDGLPIFADSASWPLEVE
jgi:hypothetical protein